MMDWIRERLREPNSQRALAIGVGLAGYYGFVDPQALTQAGSAVQNFATLWLMIDQFVTRQAPKA